MKTKTLILGFALLVPSLAFAGTPKHLSGVGSSLISQKAHDLCAASVGMRADEVEAFCCNLNGSCSPSKKDLGSLECSELDGLCGAAQNISDSANQALSSLEDYVSTQVSKFDLAVGTLNKKVSSLAFKKNKNAKIKKLIVKLKKSLRLAKRTELRIHGEGAVILNQSQAIREFSKNQMNHICELPPKCDSANDPAVDPTPAPQDSPGDPMPPVFEPAPQDTPGDMMPPVLEPAPQETPGDAEPPVFGLDPGMRPIPTPIGSKKPLPIFPMPADPLNPGDGSDPCGWDGRGCLAPADPGTGSVDEAPYRMPVCKARGDEVICE